MNISFSLPPSFFRASERATFKTKDSTRALSFFACLDRDGHREHLFQKQKPKRLGSTFLPSRHHAQRSPRATVKTFFPPLWQPHVHEPLNVSRLYHVRRVPQGRTGIKRIRHVELTRLMRSTTTTQRLLLVKRQQFQRRVRFRIDPPRVSISSQSRQPLFQRSGGERYPCSTKTREKVASP